MIYNLDYTQDYGGFRPSIIDTSNRLWYFRYYNNNLYAHYSDDYGQTWNFDQIATNAGDNPALDVDSSGNIHLVYEKTVSGYSQIIYVEKPSGSGWGSEVQISSGSYNHYGSFIFVRGTTKFVSYFRNSGASDRRIYVAEKVGAGSWSTTEVINNSSFNQYAQVMADSNNDLMLVYQKGTTPVYYYKQRASSVWSSETVIDLNSNGNKFGMLVVSNTFYIYIRKNYNSLHEFSKSISDGSWNSSEIRSENILETGAVYTQDNKFVVFTRRASDNKLLRGIKNGSWNWTEIDTIQSFGTVVWNQYSTNRQFTYYTAVGIPKLFTDYVIFNILDSGIGGEELITPFGLNDYGTGTDEVIVPFLKIEELKLFDEYKITKIAHKEEDIQIFDEVDYYTIIHPKDDIKISDTVNTKKICKYVRWILDRPFNPNFSFEDKDDNLTLENVTTNIHNEKYHNHCLKVNFNSNSGQTVSRFYTIITHTSYGYIQRFFNQNMSYKFFTEFYCSTPQDTPFNIKIYAYPNMNLLESFNSTKVNEGWNYVELNFITINTDAILIEISSDNAEVIFDNFVVVPKPDLRNPSNLSIPYENKLEKVETLDNFDFTKMLNYTELSNFSLEWELLNVMELAFLKGLKGEKIIIRTHDAKAFAVQIKSIEIEVPPRYEELTQKYNVRLNCYVY